MTEIVLHTWSFLFAVVIVVTLHSGAGMNYQYLKVSSGILYQPAQIMGKLILSEMFLLSLISCSTWVLFLHAERFQYQKNIKREAGP